MPFLSEPLKPIPLDPFAVGREFGVKAVSPRLLQRGTPETRSEHDHLRALLESVAKSEPSMPRNLSLRVRSVDGMARLAFSAGILGSGQIVSGIDALSGCAVFQVRGSGLAAPVAAALMGTVRSIVPDMGRPLRVVTRPVGAAMFDPAMYRPERLMVFRPRGLGRTHTARHARVDAYTCWVGSGALPVLFRALVTGVEVAQEVSDRRFLPPAVHEYVADVRPGY